MVYRPLRYEQMMRAAEAFDGRARRMFGGMGVYTGEKMFAFLSGDDVALKLCPSDYEEVMAMEGAGPCKPDPEMDPMREYVTLPREIIDSYEKFTYWVERSANYVNRRLAVTS